MQNGDVTRTTRRPRGTYERRTWTLVLKVARGRSMGTEINPRDVRVGNHEPFLSLLEFIRVFSK